MINIEEKIKEALKAGDKSACETYRLIKAKILEFKTKKNASVYDEAEEINLLRKMLKEREESIAIYKSNDRLDLAEKEEAEYKVIEKLLPEQPKESDVISYIDSHYQNGIEKKMMGSVIKEVKAALVGVDGGMVANIVKSKLV